MTAAPLRIRQAVRADAAAVARLAALDSSRRPDRRACCSPRSARSCGRRSRSTTATWWPTRCATARTRSCCWPQRSAPDPPRAPPSLARPAASASASRDGDESSAGAGRRPPSYKLATHASPWGRVVAISALLVVGGAIALDRGRGRLDARVRALVPVHRRGREPRVRRRRRRHRDRRRRAARLGPGRRTERYAFGHGPDTRRSVTGAVFGVRSRCPTSLLGRLHGRLPGRRARQRRARHPHDEREREPARLSRQRARDDDRAGRSTSPATAATRSTPGPAPARSRLQAACAPPRMSLRTGSGAIHAVMPSGRYDLDAESDARRRATSAASTPAPMRRTPCRC